MGNKLRDANVQRASVVALTLGGVSSNRFQMQKLFSDFRSCGCRRARDRHGVHRYAFNGSSDELTA